MRNHTLRPAIVVGAAEHRQLMVLAMAGTGHSADAADDLLYEMERARVVPDNKLADDVIRMGSQARYRTHDGQEKDVTLVYPANADISQGKVSVLTPIGTALIGLRSGQSITWLTRDGRKNVLTVLTVTKPEPEPAAEAAE